MKTTPTATVIALCCEYSDNPETLRTLIGRLSIEVGPATVIPSPWNDDPRRPLDAVHMIMTVNGYAFPYYGSHHDAQAFAGVTDPRTYRRKAIAASVKARKDFQNGLLYALLCCIKSDYSVTHESPEDLGMHPDSIADMAKWNGMKEHARKLQTALRLTPEELNSLPS